MDNRKRNAINNFAYKLRHILELQTPLDLRQIVADLEGKIVYSSSTDGREAKIEKVDEDNIKFQITLPEETSPIRDRFTIAHELGHLFLHMGYIVDSEKWEATKTYKDSAYYRFGHNEEEYEANEFAGALLMPENEFREISKKFKCDNNYHLVDIANHFQVSTEAVKVRGRWLGMFSWE